MRLNRGTLTLVAVSALVIIGVLLLTNRASAKSPYPVESGCSQSSGASTRTPSCDSEVIDNANNERW
jgi:hypothetical protein